MIRHGKPTLDWLVLEHEDDEFPPALDAKPQERKGSHARLAVFAGVCVLAAVLAFASQALIRAADDGLATIEGELESTIALEEWRSAQQCATGCGYEPTGVTAGAAERTSGVSAARPEIAAPRATLLDVKFHKDLAVAEVLESRAYPDGQRATLRTRRFYSFDGLEWVLVEPGESYWGARLTLATKNLIFEYRKRDRSIVEAAAPSVDAAYGEIRRAMGLDSPASKPTVIVMTRPQRGLIPNVAGNELILFSPALLPEPVDLAPEQVFVWQALPLLAQKTLEEASAGRAIHGEWSYMARVVNLWLVLKHHDLETAWRADVLAWRNDDDAPEAPQGPIAAGLADLCRAHRVWERALWLHGSGILALCLSPQQAEEMHLLDGNIPVALAQMQARSLNPYDGPCFGQADPMLATTVLDYAVDAFGGDAVAKLWQGFHEHHTWDELIPAVFGVSVQKFERGWQEY